jgi:hypothetical protein
MLVHRVNIFLPNVQHKDPQMIHLTFIALNYTRVWCLDNHDNKLLCKQEKNLFVQS